MRATTLSVRLVITAVPITLRAINLLVSMVITQGRLAVTAVMGGTVVH
jgi:hypothetical protein